MLAGVGARLLVVGIAVSIPSWRCGGGMPPAEGAQAPGDQRGPADPPSHARTCATCRVETLTHDISWHVPHHVSTKIPWYNLRKVGVGVGGRGCARGWGCVRAWVGVHMGGGVRTRVGKWVGGCTSEWVGGMMQACMLTKASPAHRTTTLPHRWHCKLVHGLHLTPHPAEHHPNKRPHHTPLRHALCRRRPRRCARTGAST